MKQSKLVIDAKKVSNLLAFGAIFLTVASCVSVAIYYASGEQSVLARKLMKFFYVELELNAPAFFSTVLLLIAALLLSLIYFLKRRTSEPGITPWLVLACGFTVMAFDEIASVHERLIEPMRSVLGGEHFGILYFAWVVPAIFLVLILAIYFFRFLLELPMNVRIAFVGSAALFLGGAIGLELIEGWYSELYGKEQTAYIALTTCEELFEMLGVIIFIRSLLNYISDHMPEIKIGFVNRQPSLALVERPQKVAVANGGEIGGGLFAPFNTRSKEV